MAITVDLKQEGREFYSCAFCVAFACALYICMGTLVSSQKYAKLGVRLISYSKLPIGMNVSMDGCLSLYMSSAMNW